ncbi:MAG TPA: flagellin [Pirellulales bacterium]|jgi:flagellin|nr:flagellin [Pirellulales bacterium]
MSISILNNIASLEAQNQLGITQTNLQKTLFQLSSGSRINSGADDAAGLAIANGLQANITALTQSANNANDGVGSLQVADGALSQVTTLLNRAVTLATEASTGTVSSAQRGALDAEFTQIKAEIDRIGSTTTFNGTSVFTASTTSVFLSDANSTSQIGVTVGTLASSAIVNGSSTVNLSSDALTTATGAQSALTDIDTAVANVAGIRGSIGAGINRLQSAVNVINNQVQNLTSAEDQIVAANIPQQVANLSQFTILNQSGISALAQANSAQQSILNLLR